MKRFLALIAVLSVLVISFVACGQKPAETPAVTEAAAGAAAETTFTGVLEEKKDFMVIVTGEDGVSYIFNLDGVQCDAEVGDSVTVTYTGDLADPDAQLMALDIVQAQ